MAAATPAFLCISVENDCTRRSLNPLASPYKLRALLLKRLPHVTVRGLELTRLLPEARHRSASPCWCRTKTLPMNGRSASSVAMPGPLLSCWRLLTLGRRSRVADTGIRGTSARPVGRWDGHREGWSRTQRRCNRRPPRRVVQLRYRMALPVIERGTPIIWFHTRLCRLRGAPSFPDSQIPVKPLDCCCSPTSVSTAKRRKSHLTRYRSAPSHANWSRTYGLKMDLLRPL
jgi:hypothetical protein